MKKRGLPIWMSLSSAAPSVAESQDASMAAPVSAPKRRKVAETDSIQPLSFGSVKEEEKRRDEIEERPEQDQIDILPSQDSAPSSFPKAVPPKLLHASLFSQENDDDDWITDRRGAPAAMESQPLQFVSPGGSQIAITDASQDAIQIEETSSIGAPESTTNQNVQDLASAVKQEVAPSQSEIKAEEGDDGADIFDAISQE